MNSLDMVRLKEWFPKHAQRLNNPSRKANITCKRQNSSNTVSQDTGEMFLLEFCRTGEIHENKDSIHKQANTR